MGPDTADGRRPLSPLGGGGPNPYIIETARGLIAQMDAWSHEPYPTDAEINQWAGSANWVLKELTRGA